MTQYDVNWRQAFKSKLAKGIDETSKFEEVCSFTWKGTSTFVPCSQGFYLVNRDKSISLLTPSGKIVPWMEKLSFRPEPLINEKGRPVFPVKRKGEEKWLDIDSKTIVDTYKPNFSVNICEKDKYTYLGFPSDYKRKFSRFPVMRVKKEKGYEYSFIGRDKILFNSNLKLEIKNFHECEKFIYNYTSEWMSSTKNIEKNYFSGKYSFLHVDGIIYFKKLGIKSIYALDPEELTLIKYEGKQPSRNMEGKRGWIGENFSFSTVDDVLYIIRHDYIEDKIYLLRCRG